MNKVNDKNDIEKLSEEFALNLARKLEERKITLEEMAIAIQNFLQEITKSKTR